MAVSNVIAFLLTGLFAGSYVATSVFAHLKKASYPQDEVEFATIAFLLASFALAGLFGLSFNQAYKFKQLKFVCLAALAMFLLFGFVFAGVTLTDFYDKPSGRATDWFFDTFGAFGLFGALPAGFVFALGWSKNSSKSGSG